MGSPPVNKLWLLPQGVDDIGTYKRVHELHLVFGLTLIAIEVRVLQSQVVPLDLAVR